MFTTRPDPDAAAAAGPGASGTSAPSGPNALWVTDLTYVPTWAGVAYVCFIVDAFSRRIVGWRVARTCAPTWSSTRCEMAAWQRGTRLVLADSTRYRNGDRLRGSGGYLSIDTVAHEFPVAAVQLQQCLPGTPSSQPGTVALIANSA